MKVKDIIKDAIIFAGKNELLSLNTFNPESETSPTIDQQSLIDSFVRCFNYVYKEIAISYLPLLHKETLTFVDNKVEVSSFTKNLVTIKKVVKNRKNLKFYVFPTSIYCETDKADVVYTYVPNDMTLTEDVEMFGGRMIPQIISYGIAREYNFLNADYPEAEFWDSKFNQAISQVASKAISILPRRRFR